MPEFRFATTHFNYSVNFFYLGQKEEKKCCKLQQREKSGDENNQKNGEGNRFVAEPNGVLHKEPLQ